MDERSEKRLENILSKSPKELTEEEISFLKARRNYLKNHQKEEFRSVLTQTSEKETVKKKDAKTKKDN